MRPETAKYLQDMLDAGTAIANHIAGKSREDFLGTRWVRDAVHWNFCIVGEALSQLNKSDPATAAQLSDYQKIIGLRNQLIHGYSVIDPRITWDIANTKLALLIQELHALLGI